MPADVAGLGIAPLRLLAGARQPAAVVSARAISADSVTPKAAAIRTSSVAVGLVSPRSMALSMAFETPERCASSASDHSRCVRSARMRRAIPSDKSSDILAIRLL